jgi:hypothetical protein
VETGELGAVCATFCAFAGGGASLSEQPVATTAARSAAAMMGPSCMRVMVFPPVWPAARLATVACRRQGKRAARGSEGGMGVFN